MKINNLTNGLIATLLLASPIVGAETQYPASDFKPKVIYQDTGSSQDKPATASTKPAKSVEVDAKYPAADFEPKVLYKDSDYKPSKMTASERAVTSEAAATATEAVAEESMLSYLLGLAVFAVAGYVFLTKRDKSPAKASAAPAARQATGATGVGRYLRKHNMGALTGVAKYLESQVSSAKGSTSGVEKYLEKQAKAAKDKAVQASTGVEKYMRNRG